MVELPAVEEWKDHNSCNSSLFKSNRMVAGSSPATPATYFERIDRKVNIALLLLTL